MANRFYVSKQTTFRQEETNLLERLQGLFPKLHLNDLRIYEVYDVFGATEEELELLATKVLCHPGQDEIAMDQAFDPGRLPTPYLVKEAKEGQFDQRALVAGDTLKLLSPHTKASIKSARLFTFNAEGDAEEVYETLKSYLLSSVDEKEKDLSQLTNKEEAEPYPLRDYSDFLDRDDAGLKAFLKEESLAMSLDDIRLVQAEFRKYGRVPTEVEIKVLDTYWSDHCRHSTFLTNLTEIENQSERFTKPIDEALARYQELRDINQRVKDPSLMDLATIVGRDMRRQGLLDRQEVSEEINACSVHIEADRRGESEDWLLMFKNETHNHPTEIEPFGGAGTCLGGCIRDPLSGRAKVYQGIRVTGAGDINTPIEDTLEHKLPQSYLSTVAAKGFSDYGNQIGVASTLAREVYHPGYVAKRMELGALVAAAPRENVLRADPVPGDVILLLGGTTGRDGVGGATGSSQVQDKESAQRSGAEVQKGNPPIEGNIMRLFERPEISKLIRKCNDFGAGGVSVAVGELADSLDIDLDKVTTKYAGLNAMELAISESQERMAVLIAPDHVEQFIAAAAEEDCAATVIATVTDSGFLRMRYQGETVFEISREFLETNGADRHQSVVIKDLDRSQAEDDAPKNLSEASIYEHLSQINYGSQNGLVEQFDSTIGRTTVLMPLGGDYQASEEMASVHTLPISEGTETVSVMTYGYSTALADDSPYLMGAYSVVEALSKLVASGVDYKDAFLSNQEFFPSLGDDEERWGHVFAALLGLMEAQEAFGSASIGGKDSMSGSYENIHVPPTLYTFAVAHGSKDLVRSVALPQGDLKLIYLPHRPYEDGRPNYEQLKAHFETLLELNRQGKIYAASAIRQGGLIETLAKMSLGNRKGIKLIQDLSANVLFRAPLGGLVFAVEHEIQVQDAITLGVTQSTEEILWNEGVTTPLEDLSKAISSAYEKVYPLNGAPSQELPEFALFTKEATTEPILDLVIEKADRVQVLIPKFPGDNGAEDLKAAFEATGATVKVQRIRQSDPQWQIEDLSDFCEALQEADILAMASSYSLGNYPAGAGSFIANFLLLDDVHRAMEEFMAQDKLVLGINNGFQALVRAGYLPEVSFAKNPIGRHVSRMVNTRVRSNTSPWLAGFEAGQVFALPVSASEGALQVNEEDARRLFEGDNVAMQYVDKTGQASLDGAWNPLAADYAIEALTSDDGRILGKMTHSERYMDGLWANVPGEHDHDIFANGVAYIAATK